MTMFQRKKKCPKLKGRAGQISAFGEPLLALWQEHMKPDIEVHCKIRTYLRLNNAMEKIMKECRAETAFPEPYATNFIKYSFAMCNLHLELGSTSRKKAHLVFKGEDAEKDQSEFGEQLCSGLERPTHALFSVAKHVGCPTADLADVQGRVGAWANQAQEFGYMSGQVFWAIRIIREWATTSTRHCAHRHRQELQRQRLRIHFVSRRGPRRVLCARKSARRFEDGQHRRDCCAICASKGPAWEAAGHVLAPTRWADSTNGLQPRLYSGAGPGLEQRRFQLRWQRGPRIRRGAHTSLCATVYTTASSSCWRILAKRGGCRGCFLGLHGDGSPHGQQRRGRRRRGPPWRGPRGRRGRRQCPRPARPQRLLRRAQTAGGAWSLGAEALVPARRLEGHGRIARKGCGAAEWFTKRQKREEREESLQKEKVEELQVLQQLENLKKVEPKEQRMKEWRSLLRSWHPDKNPEKAEVATQVFQFLQKGKLLLGL
ncbi:unnamed protein product [Symbiodinium microadriaticum]|nr:unnamed protein product [Symbiodinium microadriaticum]